MDEPEQPGEVDEDATPRPLEPTRPLPLPARPSDDVSVTSGGEVPSNRNVDPEIAPPRPGKPRRRYRKGAILGKGGMGEVRMARDRRIGRSVAMKVMLEEDVARPAAQHRFLREARVQGQLEHPSVVPVYDLGWDAEGRPYFVMKRVAGVTLGEVLRELRKGNAEYEAKYSLRRLLSYFRQICLALEYAHSRGVVHRDVKPSNLMFGDFGEVYILDWGIAKIVHGAEVDTPRLTRAVLEGATSANDVLGTPGFMAPEQLMSASVVDPRADVYSLGAVLFQLLTLEPLHGRGTAEDRTRSTQVGADARASRRAPHRDIPPELDAICVRATALDPDDRYPSARALHDAVEAFLEGDRDTRLRAELAEQHVERARGAIEEMLAPGDGYAEHRKRALAEAGRALALDPKNDVAASIVARMMLESPREIPPEVRATNEEVLRVELRKGVRLGSLALLAVVAGSVFLPLLGAIRSYAAVAVILGSIGVAGVYGLARSATHRSFSRMDIVLVAIPICVAIAGFSLIVGPFVVPPVLGMGFAALIAITHWLGRYRILLIGMTCASWAIPGALDWLGIGPPPAYRFEDGIMLVFPRMMEIPEAATRGGLSALFLAATVVVSALLWHYSGWVAESRERLHLHAWHLEHIVPRERAQRGSVSSRPPPASGAEVEETADLLGSTRTLRS